MIITTVTVLSHPREERRRRQLFGITNHHQLTTTGNRADRLLGLQLGCFVHDDEVKLDDPWSKILRHGLRPHHEAGLECLNRPTSTGEDLPNRHAWALLWHEVVQENHLSAIVNAGTVSAGRRRGLASAFVGDCLATQSNDLLVQSFELVADLVVFEAREAPKLGDVAEGFPSDRAVGAVGVGVWQFVGFDAFSLKEFHELRQGQLVGLFAASQVKGPRNQKVLVFDCLLNCAMQGADKQLQVLVCRCAGPCVQLELPELGQSIA